MGYFLPQIEKSIARNKLSHRVNKVGKHLKQEYWNLSLNLFKKILKQTRIKAYD